MFKVALNQFRIDEAKVCMSVCLSVCLSVGPSQAIPQKTIEVVMIKFGMVTATDMVSRVKYIDFDLYSRSHRS